MSAIAGNGTDTDTYFHPVTNGFRGTVILRGGPTLDFRLRTWDLSGGLVSDLPLEARSIAPLPDGSSIAVVSPPAAASPPANPSLVWVDAAGQVTRTVALDDDVYRVIVNWPTGHLFAFVGGTSSRRTHGRWYDGAGSPLTSWFDIPISKGDGGYQRLLADGVVALGTPGQPWSAAVRDGVTGTEPVPGWLAARPGTRLVTIRGGRGYAVLPNSGTGSFEIVATTGDSCGTVTVPQPSSDTSVAVFPPPRLDVGWDGTVFQSFMIQAAGSTSPGRCVFRWWTALLE
jgi:hypothetical protein